MWFAALAGDASRWADMLNEKGTMKFSIHENEAEMQVVFIGLDECPRCGATLCDEMCVPCAKRKIRAMEAAQQSMHVDDADQCYCGEPFPENGYCQFCGAHQRHRQ